MATLEAQTSTLKVGDQASPEVFNAIGEIRSISGPSGSAAEIDVTNLDSTAREFRLGLPDEGSVNVTFAYDPDDTYQEVLRSIRAARTSRNFKIELADSPPTTFSFVAYCTEFSLDTSVDEVVLVTATLRITGSVTKS